MPRHDRPQARIQRADIREGRAHAPRDDPGFSERDGQLERCDGKAQAPTGAAEHPPVILKFGPRFVVLVWHQEDEAGAAVYWIAERSKAAAMLRGNTAAVDLMDTTRRTHFYSAAQWDI
jgi:hypothetical protein